MARGIWQKNSKLNSFIIQLINKSNKHMTTREIQQKLIKEYHIKRSWQTIQNYLIKLEEHKHLSGIIIEKNNTIHLWKK